MTGGQQIERTLSSFLADIWFRAKGSANTKVSVSLDFYLVDADASGA